MRLAGLKVNPGDFLSENDLLFAVRARYQAVLGWSVIPPQTLRELLLPHFFAHGGETTAARGDTREPELGLACLMAERKRG